MIVSCIIFISNNSSILCVCIFNTFGIYFCVECEIVYCMSSFSKWKPIFPTSNIKYSCMPTYSTTCPTSFVWLYALWRVLLMYLSASNTVLIVILYIIMLLTLLALPFQYPLTFLKLFPALCKQQFVKFNRKTMLLAIWLELQEFYGLVWEKVDTFVIRNHVP